MRKSFIRQVVLLIVAGLVLISSVFGHGTEGKRETVADYGIEFMSEPIIPLAGKETLIEVHFENDSTEERLKEVSVEVILLLDGREVLRKELSSDEGDVEFRYTFSAGGEYLATVKLTRVDGKQVSAQAAFPLKVIEGAKAPSAGIIIAVIFASAAGGVIYYLLKRKKRKEIEEKILKRDTMAKDPVCGMDIDEKKAAKTVHEGKTYHFCSPTCKWTFDSDPKQFVQGKSRMKM